MAINYSVSGIIYAKPTTENLAVANSISGVGELTDVITPPSLLDGKITFSTSSSSVTGTDTDFQTDLLEGDYLFAYTATGVPALVGKIDTINSITSLTLTTDASYSSPTVARNYGSSSFFIRSNESVLIRIPAVPVFNVPNTIMIPSWANFRLPVTTNSFGTNNSAVSSVSQYSESGQPLVIDGTPTNIPFSIIPITKIYISQRNGVTLPSFIFAEINFFGAIVQELIASTMYSLFTNSIIPGEQIGTRFLPSGFANNSGYTLVSTTP